MRAVDKMYTPLQNNVRVVNYIQRFIYYPESDSLDF
jgi:hypothetical protein